MFEGYITNYELLESIMFVESNGYVKFYDQCLTYYSHQSVLCIRTTLVIPILIMAPRRRQVVEKCPVCGKFKGKGPCRICAARQGQVVDSALSQSFTPSAASIQPTNCQQQFSRAEAAPIGDVIFCNYVSYT
ncbi:hypothetical protein Pmar_PMAR000343 [Perkinsus marinus ATCC 50983]|uniref:Uncharacterized protein n=1 Tax=Perkinsus marinus (strain ATCC 50983 / TXsc) TaxID=423536 RepID=C5M1G9_PERM5|nr:hypothetical protein Pmar_PMAR000343 [Perkinsus marinus ATCC 50983]EEQ97176.1 hypothetical protein Pmar_PMAR000343 [Perkinsus marinus ATCC 50983]|eukprot:XP_002764459.1 hypothetical protein Pmar_PMAR000343 [Perkinsus marinus ATCC 50983]